ncbi:hypothetical protein [Sulfolobus acidocaldarius]|uniref:hypothetical protein n=1 Tax=Sulfolobus acidocaldarius TaxID=2285 RepID=UPI001E2CA0D6|nr:hypothetical protein [Sulfolobus acidocaldarius]
MGSLGHDEVLRNYMLADYGQSPVMCYIHDLFKGILPAGRDKNDSTYYEICDHIASIAEESEKLIEAQSRDQELFKNVMNDLPSKIVISFDLRGFPILLEENNGRSIKVERSLFQNWFKDLSSEYVRNFIDFKYGNGTYDQLRNIAENGKPFDMKTFSSLIDSIKFFPQRSWISGNDISVLAHLKGALLADLLFRKGVVKVFSISNPFETDLRTLKDVRGLYIITNIFLYHLNLCLWDKLNIDFQKALEKVLDTENLGLYAFLNMSIVDFFNSFVFNVYIHESEEINPSQIKSFLTVFYNDEKSLEECTKTSLKDTIETIYTHAWPKLVSDKPPKRTERKSDIILVVSELGKVEKDSEDKIKLAEKVNELLKTTDHTDYFRIIKIEYDGSITSDKLCDKCKVRKAVKLEDSIWDELRSMFIVKEDERLCDICLTTRIASSLIGEVRQQTGDEGLYLKRTEKILVRQSIDEFAKGKDLIYLVFKLDMKHVLKDRKISISDFFEVNKLEVSLNEFLSEIINVIKGMTEKIKDFYPVKKDCNFNQNFQGCIELFLRKYLEKLSSLSKPDADTISEFLVECLCKSENGTTLKGMIKSILMINGVDKSKKKDNMLINNIARKTLTNDPENEMRLKFFKKRLEFVKMISAENNEMIDISISLDRTFSLKIHFSILVEYLEYLLINSNIDYITLIPSSSTTEYSMLAIKKDDLPKVLDLIGKVFGIFDTPGRAQEAILEHSIKIFLIKAKPETPLYMVFRLLDREVTEINGKDDIRVVDVVPVILNKGGMPIGDLNSFSYNELFTAFKRISEHGDPQKLNEFVVSSAPDVTYPEFREYKKVEGFEKYVKRYSSDRKPFSVKYERDDIIMAYVARLLA